MAGLYLEPPAGAVVVSIDEKSEVQALDRTAPILPLRPGWPSGRPTARPKGIERQAETRRKIDPEFRVGAVRTVRETGKPVSEVALILDQ